MRTAIIAGTGFNPENGFSNLSSPLTKDTISTKYGPVDLWFNDEFVYLNRHGDGHKTPPHRINARAQIKALAQLNVTNIGACFAVGAINPSLKLATPILVSDFIDHTSGTVQTFFEPPHPVTHVDMSQAFCPMLGDLILSRAKVTNQIITGHGVYICTNGPRFETPAEIKAFGKWGADIVGMTLCPEIILAKEMGMSYAALAYSINWAAGITKDIQFHQGNIEPLKANMIEILYAALQDARQADCQPARLFTPDTI